MHGRAVTAAPAEFPYVFSEPAIQAAVSLMVPIAWFAGLSGVQDPNGSPIGGPEGVSSSITLGSGLLAGAFFLPMPSTWMRQPIVVMPIPSTGGV
jgi:hypothetical protein